MSDEVTPATGSNDPGKTELSREEEPIATGTLFLSMIILLIIAGTWVIMYLRVLEQ